MGDKVKGFIITLDNEYDADAVEAIRTALSMVRGVVDVAALPVKSGYDDHVNRQMIRHEMRKKLIDALS